MIKTTITGVAGRMGGRILSLLMEEEGIEIIGAIERERHPVVGKDAGVVAGGEQIGVLVSDRIEQAASDADVVVDFTAPGPTLGNAEYASKTGKAMVIGTTGFSEDEKKKIESLAKGFPCVISPNMSIGVNVMFEVASKLAQFLGDEFDVEIVEAHHRFKPDSPSGTALKLGEVVAEALARDFKEVARFERYGRIGERRKDEIGIQTIRGGDIVGEHTLMFCGIGERVEFTHRALSRDNFARGAIRALKWVVGKPPGIYTMRDVLGIYI